MKSNTESIADAIVLGAKIIATAILFKDSDATIMGSAEDVAMIEKRVKSAYESDW